MTDGVGDAFRKGAEKASTTVGETGQITGFRSHAEVQQLLRKEILRLRLVLGERQMQDGITAYSTSAISCHELCTVVYQDNKRQENENNLTGGNAHVMTLPSTHLPLLALTQSLLQAIWHLSMHHTGAFASLCIPYLATRPTLHHALGLCI